MTGAGFIHCPDCGRLMLGQGPYSQPHDCPSDSSSSPGTTGADQ